MEIVSVNKLVKRFDKLVALDHLSFSVKENEIFGLLGPLGSGKSTAIQCILSLLTYDKGDIQLFSKDTLMNSYEIRRNTGVVLQNIACFDELTVYENIHYFCNLYVNNKIESKAFTEEVLSFVGLESFAGFYPKKLSFGMQKQLNLACGIVHKPKLLILDDPTMGADPRNRNLIMENIKILNKKGTTILLASHDIEEIEQLCTTIGIMDKGRIIAKGSKNELTAMISLGEIITVEVFQISQLQLEEIKRISNVETVMFHENQLVIKSKKGKNNLLHVLDYLQENHIYFGKIFTEIPNLNDVFLELTGKSLK